MVKASKEIVQKHEQMFYPTVRVRTKKAGGSGTVVYSKKHKDEVYTYVITNHHVISDSVHIEKKWDPVLKRKVDKEILDTVFVEFFRYNNYSHTIGSFAVEADIVAYSEVNGGQDWALLRVRDKENPADWIANLFPLKDMDDIHIFDDVYAVGASLGHPPVASVGMITYMDDEIEHFKYWMSSAPTIFGNSGGAVYRWSGINKQYEYVGIPSRISIQPMGFSADAITHMGYFIPIDRIYNLLEDNDYQFIYDDNISIEDCKKSRKAKQEPEKEKDDDDD
jgi:S1-C subfamily serine protease|tara:strand:- start:1367 stop:2203 length:837 start_codon:yes stop_codon:yes gene_type:complete